MADTRGGRTFFFKGMFAATAATIVSGAVAERIKIGAFMIFTIIYVGLVYPIVGAWKWGGGFLGFLGLLRFRGIHPSTLRRRMGRFGGHRLTRCPNRKIRRGWKAQGDSRVTAFPWLQPGVLILWLGWFGFNGGSVLSADPELTSLVLVTTSLAAAAGGIGSVLLEHHTL